MLVAWDLGCWWAMGVEFRVWGLGVWGLGLVGVADIGILIKQPAQQA